jgi:hypothetical protein
LPIAVAAAVTIGCCIASARRLARVLAPTPLDLSLLTRALDVGADARVAIVRVLAADRELSWEGAVLGAADERDPEVRGAVLGELLTELDGRIQNGARTPRVCASIATSGGFLCATAALLYGLAAVPDAEPLAAAEGLLVVAMAALTVGVAGATFCAAVHLRARRASRARAEAAEALVHRLLE